MATHLKYTEPQCCLKTAFIVLRTPNKLTALKDDHKSLIQSQSVKGVGKAGYLGMLIDEQLKRNNRVSELCNYCSLKKLF